MRKLSIFLTAGLITFFVGVLVAAIWISRKVPTLEKGTALNTQCNPGTQQRLDRLKIGEDGYFPEQVLYNDMQLDRATRTWYARYLSQLQEPSLVKQSQNTATIYRFLWVRSFRSTIVVRLWTDGERKMLTVKELTKQTPDHPSELAVNQTRILRDDEWVNFTNLFSQMCLWNLPNTSGAPIAMDGEWWILEEMSDNHYHVTTRQTPDDAYREVCLYMLRLSGISFELVE